MTKRHRFCIRILLAWIITLSLAAVDLRAQQPFSELIGDVKVGEVAAGDVLEVPFILWGGDVATFHANGGLTTKPGTIFAGHGLKLNLAAGDNFPEQVKGYLTGRTPFLRGTFSMLGQASEVLNADPRTRPVVFLQLTWSAGDHMVARAGLTSANDLKAAGGKKKKVALQKFGPHAGMFDDVLHLAKMSWDEVEVVWTPDVTGLNGPAELFKKDGTVDACFAITPDMIALTGGLDKKGTGGDGTVKGAHVLVSTATTLSRSIADVYACRKDFFDAHRDIVERFAAGYLKGGEELLDLKQQAGKKDKDGLVKYKSILEMTKAIYGKEAVPDDEAADGLISDANFVGLPGNVGFFLDPGNLSGFESRQKAAIALALALKNVKAPSEFLKADFGNYTRIKSIGSLASAIPDLKKKIAPSFEKISPEEISLTDEIGHFTINFQPDEMEFDKARYESDFDEALQQASTYGKAVILLRGHADLANLLNVFVRTGLDGGNLRRTRNMGKFDYFLKDGTRLELEDTKEVIKLIEGQQFPEAKQTLVVLRELSRQRAENVKKAIIDYAARKKIRFDESQIKPVSVGVEEPLERQPRTLEQMAKNRRVEFRLSRVNIEKIETDKIDF